MPAMKHQTVDSNNDTGIVRHHEHTLLHILINNEIHWIKSDDSLPLFLSENEHDMVWSDQTHIKTKQFDSMETSYQFQLDSNIDEEGFPKEAAAVQIIWNMPEKSLECDDQSIQVQLDSNVDKEGFPEEVAAEMIIWDIPEYSLEYDDQRIQCGPKQLRL